MMAHAGNIFQTIVQTVCLGALFCIAVSMIVVTIVSTLRQAEKRAKRSGRKGASAALLAAAIVAVIYGGSKTGPRFTFDNSLMYIPSATYATNDTVHIEWGYNADIHGIGEDIVFVAYETIEAFTNQVHEWVQLDQTWKVRDRCAEFQLENATNYCYMVWTDWIPEETVVTNGVYHLSGFDRIDDGTNKYVTIRVNIRITDTNNVETSIAPINSRRTK